MLTALPRSLRQAFPRKRLRTSRLSLRLKALRLRLSNYILNAYVRKPLYFNGLRVFLCLFIMLLFFHAANEICLYGDRIVKNISLVPFRAARIYLSLIIEMS